MALTSFGYLERPYMMDPYLAGLSMDGRNVQYNRKIAALKSLRTQYTNKIYSIKPVRVQIARKITTTKKTGTQFNRKIGPLAKPTKTQYSRKISTSKATRVQVSRKITSTKRTRVQFDRKITAGKLVRAQFTRRISPVKMSHVQYNRRVMAKISSHAQYNRRIMALKTLKIQYSRKVSGVVARILMQYSRRVLTAKAIHFQAIRKIEIRKRVRLQFARMLSGQAKIKNAQIRRGTVSHQICGGYLTGPYLRDPYLAPQICAHLRAQYSRKITNEKHSLFQFDRKTSLKKPSHVQYQRRVVTKKTSHVQFVRQNGRLFHVQYLRSIYNTNKLRVLWKFPSRGFSGQSWSVVAGGQQAGDFDVNNLNTDIVEQVYRSVSTSIAIQCDTSVAQGIFTDTMAILNHNLSTSAQVQFQGSNDSTFSAVSFSVTIPSTRENIYYIAPMLPTSSYRYWRLVISDPTNADGFLQLGTVVFGSALILSDPCFTQEVQRRKVHFADKVKTEAFSNVSNDRALKKAFTLHFKSVEFLKQDYANLTEVFDYVRTSLKALWIPTPNYPSRFALFGKLQEIPDENHISLGGQEDWIDFDVNVDESL